MDIATVYGAPRPEAEAQINANHVERGVAPFRTYLEVGAERGVGWTPFREAVLKFLWHDGGPRGVYDLADKLRNGSSRVNPNSMYRIIDLLKGAGLVFPIVRSKRVQIVPDPTKTDWVALQCDDCDEVELIQAEAIAGMRQVAAGLGFSAHAVLIECAGRCRACQSRLPATTAQRNMPRAFAAAE